MKIILKLTLVALMLLFTQVAFAQDAPADQYVDEGEVTQLGEVDIRVKVEAPQVSIISDRIKPEFDEVHLEKSFVKEIIGAGEKFEITNGEKRKLATRIDIDKMLKKSR